MEGMTTLTQKGQVAIPKSIRDYFNLQPSDKLHFSVEDGKIVVEPVVSTQEMRGFVKSTAPLSEDKEKAIIKRRVLKKYVRNT